MISDDSLAYHHHLISLHNNGPKTTQAVQNCIQKDLRLSGELDRNQRTYHAKAKDDESGVFGEGRDVDDRGGRIDPWMGEEDPDGVEGDGEEVGCQE
jgi:hypothetical protein